VITLCGKNAEGLVLNLAVQKITIRYWNVSDTWTWSGSASWAVYHNACHQTCENLESFTFVLRPSHGNIFYSLYL